MYAVLGSSFLWHGRITAHSASYPYVAGKWQTPTVSGNNAGQFYLLIGSSGNIGVTVHRGASGVSTLYTSIQVQLGVPITVLLNFSGLGIDVITSKGREFLSLTGIGGLGGAVAAFGVTVGAPGSGYSGHQYARTGLMVWSDKTLPDDVVKNPWQVFAPVDRKLFLPLSVGGGSASLIIQDASHTHIADSPSFSMATYLTIAEALHAHAADNVTLATTGTANLVVQEATHAHIADGVSLTTQWLLTIAEALHAHAADNVTLATTGTANLVVQEATHAHVADGVTLTTQWLLAVAEALHSHTAESVTLSLQTALVVLEALHTHAAENLTLGVTGTANLAIADATSGHTSDTVALTLNSLLAVFDAIHTHTADNLTLDTSNATALTVQDSTHAHGADNLGLSLDTWLAIVEAAHGHTADAPTLSTALALQIAESLHAHYADVVVLGFPSAPGSCPTAEEIAAAVLAALNATTIPVDMQKTNGVEIVGDGTSGDKFRSVLYVG
jgi:hypothetical protein